MDHGGKKRSIFGIDAELDIWKQDARKHEFPNMERKIQVTLLCETDLQHLVTFVTKFDLMMTTDGEQRSPVTRMFELSIVSKAQLLYKYWKFMLRNLLTEEEWKLRFD